MTVGDLVLLDYSAGALLALVIVLILTGRLVPRKSLDEAREDRDLWRDVAQTNGEVARETLGHVKAMVPITETTYDYIRALPRSGLDSRADGEDRG